MDSLQQYVASGSFYKSVVEDGSDIILIVDFEGRILYHNDSVEETLGHSPKSLIGSNFFNFIRPETLDELRAAYQKSTQSLYTESIEFQFLCKDGSYKYLEFNAINLKQKEGIEGLILDCRDITQRKKDAEELLRAQKAKEQFLANISHEIRTPINGIAGMATLLSQNPTQKEQTTYLNAIASAAENLKVIISDILDLATIESGKLKLEKIGFNLGDLLTSIIDTFAPQARSKKIELTYELDPQANRILVGDPVRLNQILLNLINNAVKFTHKGSICLKCSLAGIEKQSCKIRFDVTDTGIGIPSDKLTTIFESFSQADISVTRKYGGTGLGLTIVKQLVELQKGEILVSSQENAGTTFSVIIPYQLATSEHLVEGLHGINNENNVHRYSLKGLVVLLVEDNDINRLYATSILKLWGCKVEAAENGYVAVEKLKSINVDIILMDVQMPVMDGLEATKAIRLSHMNQSKVPIVALTANASTRDIEKCIEAGMDDTIAKPFTPDDLYKSLSKYAKPGKTSDLQSSPSDAVIREDAPSKETNRGQKIDLSYLKKLSNNNAEFLNEMMSTLLETIPKAHQQIQSHYKEEKWVELGKEVHKIKPSLAMIGLSELREKAVELEELASTPAGSPQLRDKANKFLSSLAEVANNLRDSSY